MYTMDAMEPTAELVLEHLSDRTPQKTLELLSLDPSPSHRPAPGLLEPPRSTPPRGLSSTEPARSTPPGLEQPPQPSAELSDPLMVNLSERLASLDAVVLGLGNDIAAIKSDPSKRLHRI